LTKASEQGSWDQDAYKRIVENFRDDLPFRHFIEGFRQQKYIPLVGALMARVTLEADEATLLKMRDEVGNKGLDDSDAAGLRKAIDAKVKPVTIVVPALKMEDAKVRGGLVAALAPVVKNADDLQPLAGQAQRHFSFKVGRFVSIRYTGNGYEVTLTGPAKAVLPSLQRMDGATIDAGVDAETDSGDATAKGG